MSYPVLMKKASVMLASPLDAVVLAGFSDELRKIAGKRIEKFQEGSASHALTKAANIPVPGSPTANLPAPVAGGTPGEMAEIKVTSRTAASSKSPKYSKVNSKPSPSPMAGTQPMAQAPAVRT